MVFRKPWRSAALTPSNKSTRNIRRSQRVLVFGEHENDTKLIQELLIALCPDLEGKVRAFRKPPILVRDCHVDQIPDRIDVICRLIDAEHAINDVICVFAHEDCDAIHPAHVEVTRKIEASFADLGYHVHAVTPAWETESWLFLWPSAIADYRPSWRSIDKYIGRDVGRIHNAKEELRRALRPPGKAVQHREYRESDAPLIAKKVRELRLADSPQARSASYDSFRERVKA